MTEIDYKEEGFSNRILFDVWVCIMERGEFSGADLLDLKELMKSDEQKYWDIYVGPMVDQIAENFCELIAAVDWKEEQSE